MNKEYMDIDDKLFVVDEFGFVKEYVNCQESCELVMLENIVNKLMTERNKYIKSKDKISYSLSGILIFLVSFLNVAIFNFPTLLEMSFLLMTFMYAGNTVYKKNKLNKLIYELNNVINNDLERMNYLKEKIDNKDYIKVNNKESIEQGNIKFRLIEVDKQYKEAMNSVKSKAKTRKKA